MTTKKLLVPITIEKQIFIIRHGETEYNRLNIIQGSSIDIDINEKGYLQAKSFYTTYKNISFDKVYTSVLKRTKQSVQQFINDGIPHEQICELNEICWGDLEGKNQSEVEKEMFRNIVSKWKTGNINAKIPNGESPFEMQERQKKALSYILKNTTEKTILICMHGRAMKSFLCLLLDIPLTQMEQFQHSNLGLYLLNYRNNKFELLKQNNADHLVNL
ncbi:MAG: histidine phosphatase family protein [Bacteroidota bacterium]